MYKLAVSKDFIAQHFLLGEDYGFENQKHSHHYRLEIQLQGKDLDNHGYLLDIVKVRDELEKLISYYRDRTLNELPEFKGINPSIENLACIVFQSFYLSMQEAGTRLSEVKLWEDDCAWVAYQGE